MMTILSSLCVQEVKYCGNNSIISFTLLRMTCSLPEHWTMKIKSIILPGTLGPLSLNSKQFIVSCFNVPELQ